MSWRLLDGFSAIVQLAYKEIWMSWQFLDGTFSILYVLFFSWRFAIYAFWCACGRVNPCLTASHAPQFTAICCDCVEGAFLYCMTWSGRWASTYDWKGAGITEVPYVAQWGNANSFCVITKFLLEALTNHSQVEATKANTDACLQQLALESLQ